MSFSRLFISTSWFCQLLGSLAVNFLLVGLLADEARFSELAESTVILGEKTSFSLGWGDRKAHGWPGTPVGMLAEAPQIEEKARGKGKCQRRGLVLGQGWG